MSISFIADSEYLGRKAEVTFISKALVIIVNRLNVLQWFECPSKMSVEYAVEFFDTAISNDVKDVDVCFVETVWCRMFQRVTILRCYA